MNSLILKAARMELETAKSKRTTAQLDYDAEVKLYDEYEAKLHDAFHGNVPMDKFLEVRNLKRTQARIVRDAHDRLTAAVVRVDNAETDYDIAFNAVHVHGHDHGRDRDRDRDRDGIHIHDPTPHHTTTSDHRLRPQVSRVAALPAVLSSS